MVDAINDFLDFRGDNNAGSLFSTRTPASGPPLNQWYDLAQQQRQVASLNGYYGGLWSLGSNVGAQQQRQYRPEELAGLQNANSRELRFAQQCRSLSPRYTKSDYCLDKFWDAEFEKEREREKLLTPKRRHWLLRWLPVSSPVIGRDFEPKKVLSDAEKAYWSC